MRAVSAAVAVVLLAGCLSLGGDDRPDYEEAQEKVEASAAPVLVLDHGTDEGHRDATLHAGALNLELVGYHNGVPGPGQDPNDIPAGVSYNEFVVTDEYAYVARTSEDGSVGGFVILSHKDPADPGRLAYVGEYSALGGADLEVSTDESLAFFATQRSGSTAPQQGSQYDPTPIVVSGMSSQSPSSAPRGIHIVDISDKRAPQFENFIPLPVNGPHTITYYQQASGEEWLIVCTYDLMTDPATGALSVVPATQRLLVYQLMRAPPEAPLPLPVTAVMRAQYQLTDSPPAGKMYLPHDTRVQEHPIHGGGGIPLLYVAYWDKGVRVLDFSDPAAPSEIGFFTEFGPTAYGNIHLAQPFADLIDGFHVTVAQPEIQSAPDETGQVTFLDTTDPTHPEQLGHWTLPNGTSGPLGITGFDFSPHNFDLWDGKMAIGHFHAGIWVVDVSDEENLRDPKTVGYYMPAKPRDNAPTAQPAVWGVFEHQGLLWASDESTGLYVLRYTGP